MIGGDGRTADQALQKPGLHRAYALPGQRQQLRRGGHRPQRPDQIRGREQGGDPQPGGDDHRRIMASSIDQHRPGVGRALINRQRPHGARTPLVRQRAARGRRDALCRQAIFAEQPLHRSGGQKAEKAHPFRRNRVMRCAEFDHRAAQATPDRGLFPGDEGPCGGGMQRLFVQGG